jgi:acetoacetyl-CoA synthetase
MTRAELRAAVAQVAGAFRALGIRPGDRVASVLPNIPEAVVAFLATASIGAVWSSCSPDFGIEAVVERFAQVKPKVLLCADGYRYGGRVFDRREYDAQLRARLPDVRSMIVVEYLGTECSYVDGDATVS